MEILKFSSNWNNKLECNSFSTIRIYDNEKFQIGRYFKICLFNSKNEIVKEYDTATIVSINVVTINQIIEAMARIDTGYSQESCKNIIRKMYQSKNFNWESQKLMFVVLTKKI